MAPNPLDIPEGFVPNPKCRCAKCQVVRGDESASVQDTMKSCVRHVARNAFNFYRSVCRMRALLGLIEVRAPMNERLCLDGEFAVFAYIEGARELIAAIYGPAEEPIPHLPGQRGAPLQSLLDPCMERCLVLGKQIAALLEQIEPAKSASNPDSEAVE